MPGPLRLWKVGRMVRIACQESLKVDGGAGACCSAFLILFLKACMRMREGAKLLLCRLPA
jgi:hypothetical protein